MADNNSFIATLPNRDKVFLYGGANAPAPQARKLTPELDPDSKTYNVKLYDNGLAKDNSQEKVFVGTYTVSVDKDGVVTEKFIINPNNNFSPEYIKAISIQDPKVTNSVISQIKDFRENATLTARNNGEDVPGITKTEAKDLLPGYKLTADAIAPIQTKGLANKSGAELPASFKTLTYPNDLTTTGQDYIKFNAIEYKPRIFDAGTPEKPGSLGRFQRYVGLKDENRAEINKERLIKSTISLPIQSGIADNNSVTWNVDSMDAIRQAAGFASLQTGVENPMEAIGEQIKAIADLTTDKSANQNMRLFIGQFLARMAINSENNFFSRAFGAILNPNLELLFQSPDLRPFTFRFDLTPRNKEEAIVVRKIIRAFKQTMAARQGYADTFLKTPMVYDIQYINGKTKANHKSINRIKTCALKNFSVNYTPSNQYMTFEGDDQSMTQYTLDMTFQELEPIYFDDYVTDINGINIQDDEIGY